MVKEFEMTDIRLMAYYLNIEVKQKEKGVFISLESYAKKILKKFKMNDCKPISMPLEYRVKLSKHDEGEDVDPTFFKSSVGSLCYLTCARQISFMLVDLWVDTWRVQRPLILKLQKESFATSKVQLILAYYTYSLMTTSLLDVALAIKVEM